MSSETLSSGVPPVRIGLADGRLIRGFIDEEYGPLADAFHANFLERRDLGAACSVYVAGRLVVDLWGGVTHFRFEWTHWEVVNEIAEEKRTLTATNWINC